MRSSNPIKQLFGQTAVYGLGIVLPRVLNYILLTPFYTRIFPQEEYGIITELYAYVVFLLVILTYGMETGFFRFASDKNDKNRVYSSALTSLFTTSLLFITAVLLFIRPVSAAVGYVNHEEYIRWLAFIVAIDAFTAIPFARIRLLNKPAKYALIRIIEVLVNIGLNGFFLYYCPNNIDSTEWLNSIYNPNIGVGYVLISNLAASLIKLILLSGEIIAAFKGKVDMGLLRNMLQYAYPLLIAGLAGTINEALDRILLKHLLPAEVGPMAQLGIYGANFKIAVLMTLYVQMFKYAAEPFFFSKSAQKEARNLYADVLRFFMIPGLMVFLVVTLYLDYFKLFIGPDFRDGLDIVPVVLMANLIMGIFFNMSVWYKLTNKTWIGAILVFTGALVTILVNVLFIPSFGYRASAWGHLLCYSIMVVLSYLWSRKIYKIPYNVIRVLLYIGVAVMIYGADRSLQQYLPEMALYVKPVLIILAASFYVFMERNKWRIYRNN